MKVHKGMLVLAALAIACCGALQEARAQWNKKPHAEWTKKDAERVLNDSPWGKTDVSTDSSAIFRAFPNQGPVAEASRGSSAPNALHVNFRVRFFSAKPIRLAVRRQLELAHKGPRSEEFEKLLENLATGEFLEYIVVTVSCDASGPGMNFQEALGLLHSRGTADVQHNTYLETRGGRRVFLLEYQTPRDDGMGARFIFPRLVNGQPFVTEDSGEIHFVTELSPAFRIDKRFKVRDMFYERKLEY